MRSSQSRADLYRTFAQLFRFGLTDAMFGQLLPFAEIAAALPHSFNNDELASDHQMLLGFNVFPYQSIFLDASGLLGGAEADKVKRYYQDAGTEDTLGWEATADNPDHIANELVFLAALIEQESRARAGALFERQRFRDLQAGFLAEHLSRWISPFVIALTMQKNDFYTALAEWTLRTVFAHATDLEELIANYDVAADDTNAEQIPLGAKETGLREITAYLLLPVRSGIYISKQEISHLARQLTLPRGFGDRHQMFMNLLHAAVSYDRLDELISGVKDLTNIWLDSYSRHITMSAACAVNVEIWRTRAGRTTRLLDTIAELAFQSPI